MARIVEIPLETDIAISQALPLIERKYTTQRGAVLQFDRSADGLVGVAIWTDTGRVGEFGRAVLSLSEAGEFLHHFGHMLGLVGDRRL
jgi:hypothetical protein